jgi:diguanylate cyclase (GGDEF)-like protein/PAS domain S-box-containing protein
MEVSPAPGAQLRDPAFSSRGIASLLVAEVHDCEILMLDVDGHVATWNAGAQRFKGYEAEEIIGSHVSIFYPPEAIAAGAPERLLATARSQGRAQEEGWQVRKDGTRFWASIVITALCDEIDELRGYGNVTRDLTERQVAEERFRAAFTHAPIGISISDLRNGRNGRFIEVNPALAQMLGYEADELIGKTVITVTQEEQREAPAHLLHELLAGNSVSVEMQLTHRDGHELWALVSSTPLPEPPGQPPRAAISQILDISERKRLERQLRHLADHDALTGLANRHRFESELERVVAEADRHDRPGALLMMDLDGFKEVNDHFGHQTGDELISRIGGLLRTVVRKTDTIARLGGDEFAVILPGASGRDAERLARRILEAIRKRGRITVEQLDARITASVGVTAFDATTGLSGRELVVEADIAMYDAKSLGRNRRVVYDRSTGRRQEMMSKRGAWRAR